MATLKDIANLAGVSQGTVSNVLNGRGNVSSEKIKIVQAAAAQLGYTVNERAKLLRKGSSNILALILPNTRTRCYNDIYTCFKSCAEKYGYSVSVYLTNDIPAKELALISKLRSDMVAGAALISCLREDGNPYLDAGFTRDALLYLERKPLGPGNYLGFDYQTAGKALALAARSQKERFSLLTELPAYSNDTELRDGFLNGLDPQTASFDGTFTIDRNQRQKSILSYLSEEETPGLVFASSFPLANSFETVRDTFFPDELKTPIYTLSPLHTLPDNRFRKYELDYRLLGNHAAKILIEQLQSQQSETKSTILPNAGFRNWHPEPLCGPQPPVLNLLMLNGPEAAAVQHLSKLYTNYTGIRIRVSVFSYDEIYDILSTTGGREYDILRIDITFLSWFAKKLLFPLDTLDPKIHELLPTFLDGVSTRYSSVSGKVYALPFSPSVQLLYYRKDLFESTVLRRLYQEQYKCELAPPRSFDEFNRIASFFTRKNNPNSPVDCGAILTLGSIGVAGSEFMARFLENHQNLYDEDGVVRLNSPAGIRALQQIIDLKKISRVPYNTWWTDTASDFASGRMAMAILYSNYASDLLKKDSLLNDSIGYAPVPGGNPVLGGASLGVSKFSKHPLAALNYIKWLCSESISSATTLLGGVSPCKSAYRNYELLDSFPWLELAGNSFVSAKGYRQRITEDQPFNEQQFLKIIGAAVKSVYNEVQSSEEALNWAQSEFDTCFGNGQPVDGASDACGSPEGDPVSFS